MEKKKKNIQFVICHKIVVKNESDGGKVPIRLIGKNIKKAKIVENAF